MQKIISILFLSITLTILSSSANAFVGVCTFSPDDPNWFGDIDDVHVLIQSKLDIECEVNKKNGERRRSLLGSLTVVGPGIESHGYEGFILTCPLVSYNKVARRIEKKGKWAVGGLSVSAGTGLISARAAVGVNARLAACTITGLGIFGLGASVGGMSLQFNELW